MKKILYLLVVFTLALTTKSEAKSIPGIRIRINYGWPDDKGVCNPLEFGICSIVISLKTNSNPADSNSEVIEVKGEIASNMLYIKFTERNSGERKKQARHIQFFNIQRNGVGTGTGQRTWC